MATKEDLSEEWGIASTRKMISYAFGYIIINFFLSYGMVNLYYFYQDEVYGPAGVPIMTIFMLMLAAQIIFTLWNMINDPLLGYLTDKPMRWTRRFGLRAPWIVLCSIPILIFYCLLWIPPVNAGIWMIFIYFILITALFDGFFSIFNDHVYGGFTNQFPTEFERRRGFAIITLLMGGLLITLDIVQKAIQKPGEGKPETFFYSALIVSVILIIFNIILFLGIRESKEMKEMFIGGFERTEDTGFFKVMKTALKRKNFVISVLGYTISTTGMLLFNGMAIYMYLYVYKLPWAMAILPSLIGLIAFMAFIPFWSNFAKKHGFKKTYYTCFFLHGLAFIPFIFIIGGLGTITLIMVVIFQFMMYAFYSGEVCMLMPVASDACDEVSVHLKRRQDGTLQGIRTFFFRISLLVFAVSLPITFILTGYIPGAKTQSVSAQMGIRFLIAVIPAIIYIAMALVFKIFYDLEGEKKAEVIRLLKEMKLTR